MAGLAHRLGLATSTVRTHLHNAYRVLEVGSAAQAIVVCFNAGWLDPTRTKVDDPTHHPDRKVTDAQRVYLQAFDRHLRAGDDPDRLDDAKVRTDAALIGCDITGRSVASRDWIDRLIQAIARLP